MTTITLALYIFLFIECITPKLKERKSMQTGFQLAAVHGMLYTGGNVHFSPDGNTLYSPVQNYISAIQLQREGVQSMTCSNSGIQCFDLSSDGDVLIVIGQRGLGFFYSLSSQVTLDTISFPPNCTIQAVKFSPCGRYVAVGLETTLQVYTAPARRVVQFHGCHRVENLHSVLSQPILNLEWTSDSEHILVSGQDARMKIVPRQTKPHVKGFALQHNLLVGHRMAVVGAWFSNKEETQVVSVATDNVVAVWKQTELPRKELLQAIARSRLNARLGTNETNENDDEEVDEDGEVIPKSFMEKQRLEQLAAEGVRVSDADDSLLPPLLKYAFEVDKKHMLTHKGNVTVAAFHKERGLVAIGYNSGIFAVHTLREEGTFALVHLLSISAQALTAAAFSPNGDLLAFGSAHLKQLLVWNWKSEAYVLKEQSHYYDITRTAISADSRLLISGGDDGKVKVWSATSGQCYVTFNEHAGPITGIATSASTNAFFTSSLDGTARGFDLVRYRCFRVYTPPDATQLSCIAVDGSGEVIAVGSSTLNRIFLFSAQTGRIIDMLQGHEGPIACLAFHPSGTTLTSGSLDHNICFWELFSQEQSGARLKGDGEVLDIGTEVLCVTYSGSGRHMAVLTVKGEISVYETSVPNEPELIKTFQTSFDAAGGWQKEVGPNSANYNAHFTTIAFSPEGEKLIAGGDSKWLVLYHALQGYVLHKWPVTSNLDVLGAEEQYQWRGITEAGFLQDINIEETDPHLQKRKLLEMPGSRHRHFATGKRSTALTANPSRQFFRHGNRVCSPRRPMVY
ncbi:periodic tryptophan protein 2 [Angomonas deanei]|uniref:WD domain, G-beta repeat, putative n=1 Tax=Angomonas deanei TaxID=59799 RepID=A0A7G2CVF5_9TRYP|nr:periodic tryptophan protein 2 [Angomonas deanei]CAD2222292.1 WD domain, G-beta repeat, putative [Angomonas deanei]|eukprot:EPY24473.1 periodic tryptophan protein 2 [Angomonas deanei]